MINEGVLIIELALFYVYSEVSCWMHTGQRQVSKMRRAYLKAILDQEVGFFDTDARTGVLVDSISKDTVLVQDAISEKVWNRYVDVAIHILQISIQIMYMHGLVYVFMYMHICVQNSHAFNVIKMFLCFYYCRLETSCTSWLHL